MVFLSTSPQLLAQSQFLGPSLPAMLFTADCLDLPVWPYWTLCVDSETVSLSPSLPLPGFKPLASGIAEITRATAQTQVAVALKGSQSLEIWDQPQCLRHSFTGNLRSQEWRVPRLRAWLRQVDSYRVRKEFKKSSCFHSDFEISLGY